ncbi:hypothetical protein Dsin_000885 [Dipteronia sinensis]|uniref:Cytochrome b/b6 N-terminal region profile domain-containing protein n=1 Tax=Dipteronia sinensis TaxID=43782 RepID=A0AAE0B4A8_9ROSI|nr:hypothetical protein Dsin_000885 [Dipteronia sinensis]
MKQAWAWAVSLAGRAARLGPAQIASTSFMQEGVVLAVLTASFGVTGYSLPWDQIGYWAVKIVTGVPEAIPVIGSPLVELLRGSASVGQSTLTRFYSLHTFVLPLLTAVFMLMHFLMIRWVRLKRIFSMIRPKHAVHE